MEVKELSTEVEAECQDSSLDALMSQDWSFTSATSGYLTHNIHPYPAKFIPQIPCALINELSTPGETVADIFCGSGTTLLEALRLNRNAIGMDANPLATLISTAKTTIASGSDYYEVMAHRSECIEAISEVMLKNTEMFGGDEAFKSSGWRPAQEVCEFWFDPHVVEELAEIKRLQDNL